MARTVTKSELRNRIYMRANLEGHTNMVPTSEANTIVEEAVAEAYDELVAASPPDYYSNSFTITTSSNTAAYNINAYVSDLYKLRSVHVDEGSNEFRLITQVNEAEEQFYRPPQGAYSVRVRYIPACPLLANDNTTFDGINGFEEYAVLIGAVKLLTKEAADTNLIQLVMADRERARMRIRKMATRDDGEPPRVIRRSHAYRDSFRVWQNTVNAYRLRAGVIELYRLAGQYLT